MKTYLHRKKNMIFRNLNALKTVEHLINEIDQGLGNPSRCIKNSSMPEVLAASLGVGTGSAISFAALYLGGSVVGISSAGIASALSSAGAIVGGTATTGIFVLAAPMAILSFIGFKVAYNRRERRLQNAKIMYYKRSLAHLAMLKNAVSREKLETVKDDEVLSEEAKERIAYFRALSITLQAAIKDLKHDLGIV